MSQSLHRQVVNTNPLNSSYSTRPQSHRLHFSNALTGSQTQSWTSLLLKLKCNAKFSCLFSDNRREVPIFLFFFFFGGGGGWTGLIKIIGISDFLLQLVASLKMLLRLIKNTSSPSS